MKEEVIIDRRNVKTEIFKRVYASTDVIIFEGGWWMNTRDWQMVSGSESYKYGIDRNEITHELTWYHMPY